MLKIGSEKNLECITERVKPHQTAHHVKESTVCYYTETGIKANKMIFRNPCPQMTLSTVNHLRSVGRLDFFCKGNLAQVTVFGLESENEKEGGKAICVASV